MTVLYLDSARVADWVEVTQAGLTRRVTCNPLLMSEAGLRVDFHSASLLVREALSIGLEELHLQAWPSEAGDWYRTARELADLADCVVVKLPAIPDAMKVATQLKQEGFRVLVTALSNPVQGLWAAHAGADFVAPYVGRLREAGRDVPLLITTLLALQQRGGPKVLAASVRDIETLGWLMVQGVAAVTLRKGLLDKALQDEATWEAVRQFEAVRHSG